MVSEIKAFNMHTFEKVHFQHYLRYKPIMINQYAYCPEKD